MPTFMITQLPPLSTSLEAIEFMEKKNLSYHLSSDLNLFNMFMISIRSESRLAMALGFSEDFEKGKEELQLIEELTDTFISEKKIKMEEPDENTPPKQRPAEIFRSLKDPVRVKVEVVEVEDNVVNASAVKNPVEKDVSATEDRRNEPTSFDVWFEEEVEEEEEEELIQEKEDEDDDENEDMDVENNSDKVEDKDESDDSSDEDYDEESEDEQVKEKGPMDRWIQTKSKKSKSGSRGSTVGRLLYTCPIKNCPSSYNTFAELRNHVKSHSADKEDFFCDVCKYGFTTLDDALEHIRNREKKKCCECGKNFPHANVLRRHQRSHTDERPFICTECNKGFKRKSHLALHEMTHSGNKPFGCDQCNVKFAMKSSLTQHMRIHTGSKPYKCKQCKKSFSRREHLKQHEMRHSGTKPHECSECEMKFTTKLEVTKHMRAHTGSQPYACKHCEKSFSQLGNLQRHELLHSGTKPFKCDECESAFTYKDQLAAHKAIHTGKKPLACKECDQTFKWRKCLSNHMKNAHQ